MEGNYKCKICGKGFSKSDNLKKFIVFCRDKNKRVYDEETCFVICRKDLKVITDKLEDIFLNSKSYKEHYDWHQREKELLKIAKKIYSKCDCKDKKVNLNKLGDEVYDLMCEECWEKFSEEKVKLKKRILNK